MASDDSEAMSVLVARVAQAEADRAALLELLVDVWLQFSLEVRDRPGVKQDGCLSTLEDVREVLSAAGRLVPANVPGHENKDWWRLPAADDEKGAR